MSFGMRRSFALLSVAVAVIIGEWAWRTFPVTEWMTLAGLALLTFALANVALELRPGMANSLDNSISVAAFLLFGPLGAGIVASCALPFTLYIRYRTPLSVVVRNVAAVFCAATVSGFLIVHILQPMIPLSQGDPINLATLIAGAVAFVVLFQLLNSVDVALYFALIDRRRVIDALRLINPAADIPGNVLLALLGFTLAVLMSEGSWVGALLLLAPVAVVRRAFRVYADMASMYSSTLGALVSSIEAKDPYTKGHSERVAAIARRIGVAMGLDKGDLLSLERAALLHDIGKIGVPGRLLQRKEELSDEDYALIKQHPKMAVDVLAHIDYVQDLLPIIRHHHEQVSGLGYPDGLEVEDIPQLSRVLAVADAYDAMTSDRPYRPGMSSEEALRELRRCSGIQFDPRAVDALVRVLEKERDEGRGEGRSRNGVPGPAESETVAP